MKKIIDLVKANNKMVLATVFCLAVVSSYAQEIEIKAAQKLLDEDKKKASIEAFQKAINTYPEATQLYYYLGHAQIIAGDKAGAKASFEAGVTKNPKEPLNIVGLGHLLILDKNVAQAKVKFEEALKLGKKNFTAMNAIGEAYLSDKALQKDAMDILQKSKSINDKNPQTHLLIGDAHSIVLGQGGLSASSYERALDNDSKCATAEFKLGELFMSTNLPVAEEHYQKAVAIDPGFAQAHRELGELYYKKKDGPNAVKHYKKYLDLTDSPDKDDRFRYAFFLFLAKDYDNANKEFNELRKKPDVSSTTLKFAAQSQVKSGNLPEAEKAFKDYMNHSQTKVDADDFNNLAELYKKQGKDSLAMNALESSISLDQNQPEVLQTLIEYYFKGKKYDQCERVCRTAIKTRKKPFSNDFFRLGQALYLQKKYTSADSSFGKFIELQPKITLGYTWAARSKQAQDTEDLKDALAKPFYEKVIEVGEPTADKNKNDLIAAYQYMGSYHLLKSQNQVAKGYFEKVLALNPEDANAKEAIKLINTPPQQQKPKKR